MSDAIDISFAPLVHQRWADLITANALDVQQNGETELTLWGARTGLRLELSRGHAWQVSATVRKKAAPTSSLQGGRDSAVLELAAVLQALSSGLESFHPNWITSRSQLEADLDRLRRRLETNGQRIFEAEFDWQLAKEYSDAARRRSVLAAGGQSKAARRLEAADLAYGRDDLETAKATYAELRDSLSEAELQRLELLENRRTLGARRFER